MALAPNLPLVWGAAEVDQNFINLWLVRNINVCLNEGWANDLAHIGHDFGDTFSEPLCLSPSPSSTASF